MADGKTYKVVMVAVPMPAPLTEPQGSMLDPQYPAPTLEYAPSPSSGCGLPQTDGSIDAVVSPSSPNAAPPTRLVDGERCVHKRFWKRLRAKQVVSLMSPVIRLAFHKVAFGPHQFS